MTYSLDRKDRRILFELDKNARQSYSQLGKKVGLSQEVVYHRVKKLQEKGVIKRFQTVAALSKLGFIAPKIYLQLQDLTKENYKELREYLLNHDKIFWFGICQGRWDLIVAFYVKDIFEFGDLVDQLLNKFSTIIYEREVSFGKKIILYNRTWIYDDKSPIQESEFISFSEKKDLDEIDFEILRNVGNNARVNVVEIAKKMKTTSNVIHYRLKKLEKEKIILGYKIALDTHKLGYEACKSFIFFKNINKKRRNELIEFCKMHPKIYNILLCVGSWDMEIEFEVKNFDEFYDLMSDIKEEFKDIIKHYDSIVFKEEPKQSFVPGSYPETKF